MAALTVRLIIDSVNRQWIIGKMAARLAESLSAFDVRADIDEVPSASADVNHWMLYLQPWRHYYGAPGFYNAGWRPAPPTKHTAMITHVDDPLKVRIVREAMDKILDVGICMSRMTMAELTGHGIDPAKLTFINPGHDASVKPRRIVVGITSRLYPDARKGEDDLLHVARTMRLDPFRFEIIGEGWEAVADVLREAGAEVELADSDRGYGYILERLPNFDYYLYMGWDEGSMGTLDALAAGVKTIVTPQGFHLDLKDGITHSFRDSDELADVLRLIDDERQRRIDAVAGLTWSEYARKHALVWLALVGTGFDAIANFTAVSAATLDRDVTSRDLRAAKSRMRRRLFKSEFRRFYIESRRFWIRGKLSAAKRWLLRRRSR